MVFIKQNEFQDCLKEWKFCLTWEAISEFWFRNTIEEEKEHEWVRMVHMWDLINLHGASEKHFAK